MKRALVAGLLVWLLGSARLDAQTFGVAVTGETAGAMTVSTASLTASGTNRFLACGIATGTLDALNPTVSGVTFGGVNLTFRQAEEDYQFPGGIGARIELWGLALEGVVGPGVTGVITATLSASEEAAIGCVLYTGVNQTTPGVNLVTAHGRTNSASVTVSGSTGDTVVDFVSVNFQVETVKTATAGSGQTQLVQQLSSLATYPPAVLISRENGAGTDVMDWTFASGNLSWASIGVAIVPDTAVSNDFTIEVEDYNTGGEGVAYHDTTSGNAFGAYRTDDVDLYAYAPASNGVILGNAIAGEWLTYTHPVLTTGTYTLNFRVASDQSGGLFRLEVDGADLTGAIAVPNTTSFLTFTTVTFTGVLTAGSHLFRLVMDTNGSPTGVVGNFDYVSATFIPTTGGGGGKMILLGVGGHP